MTSCDRCGKTTNITKTSWFSSETICADGPDACSSSEEKMPGIEAAKQADIDACSRGDFNFQGIGWDKRHTK